MEAPRSGETGGPDQDRPYRARGNLHHGIQPTLGGVQVSRNQLLANLCLKLAGVVSELQHVAEGKWGLAFLLLVGARIPQLLRVCVDEGEHRLVHKGPEAWRGSGMRGVGAEAIGS